MFNSTDCPDNKPFYTHEPKSRHKIQDGWHLWKRHEFDKFRAEDSYLSTEQSSTWKLQSSSALQVPQFGKNTDLDTTF